MALCIHMNILLTANLVLILKIIPKDAKLKSKLKNSCHMSHALDFDQSHSRFFIRINRSLCFIFVDMLLFLIVEGSLAVP